MFSGRRLSQNSFLARLNMSERSVCQPKTIHFSTYREDHPNLLCRLIVGMNRSCLQEVKRRLQYKNKLSMICIPAGWLSAVVETEEFSRDLSACVKFCFNDKMI